MAVTGEWCHEVLEDYLLESHLLRHRPRLSQEKQGQEQGYEGEGKGIRWAEVEWERERRRYKGEGSASLFRGRGVQYHLGFHHYSDTCRLVIFFVSVMRFCCDLYLYLEWYGL